MPDYTLGDTVYKRFTTRAFATGIPGTLGGTPVISAYEDDSATQITAGITLGVDHDGVSGLNLLTIVATGANGYGASQSYDLVITTGTVGGVSVIGEVVWHFTLGAESAVIALATTTYTEPSSIPSATSSIPNMLHWLFTMSRNLGLQTSALKTLRNDGNSADIATTVISDDGTTFTRNEWT